MNTNTQEPPVTSTTSRNNNSSSFFSWPSMMPVQVPVPPRPAQNQEQSGATTTAPRAAALQSSYQMPGYRDYANATTTTASSSSSSSTTKHPRPGSAAASAAAAESPLTVPAAVRGKSSSDLVFPQKLHMLLTASEHNPELAR